MLVASGRIAGVFDWGCSFYGDFLYDIAWLEFWSPWYEALEAIGFRNQVLLHHADRGAEIPDVDARIRSCMIHIALDHQAYNAHTRNLDGLVAVTDRLLPLLD